MTTQAPETEVTRNHEVTRNLSEPSDQTVMHIDVYADYLSAISPQTPSRALRALLTRGGSINQFA